MSQQVGSNPAGPETERSKLRARINANVPEAVIAGFDEWGVDKFSHLAHVHDKDLEELGMPKLKRRKLLSDIYSLPSSRLVGECQLSPKYILVS